MFGSFGSTLKSFQWDISNMLDEMQNDPKGGRHRSPYSPYSGMPRGRVYVRGWAPRMERSDVGRQSTIHDTGVGLARSVSYRPVATADGSDRDSYAAVKARCLQANALWEDPDFPPTAKSLFYKRPPSGWPDIQWKRPHEICANPQLFVDGASRMDVVQGIIGDCWLAAVASLSTNGTLMKQIIPLGQSFQTEYAGVFRFNFWQYGRWVEVLVDDRLPTSRNKLLYMHSETRNEFWSALLEKAYAKLSGSYEALAGGLMSEALTDVTGGIVERFELGSKASSDLQNIMLKAYKKSSLMGCSIDAADGRMEQRLNNGLLTGHAYAITNIRKVRVQTSRMSGDVVLIRVRNPWGDSHEWNGAWSDRSVEWTSVPASEKASMGLTFDHDGEFWISFKDFVNNFQRLDVCYLGPDSLTDEHQSGQVKWEGALFEGSWRRRVNAGGCRNYPSSFWTNPQYNVSISGIDADDDDGSGRGSVVVALMQKHRRRLRREGKTDLTIGYAVYKAPSNSSGTLDARFFQTHSTSAKCTAFSNLREVCERHKLAPGNYVIVPSTFEPGEEGDFILRFFSERPADAACELDDVTGPTSLPQRDIGNVDKAGDDRARQVFARIAGSDGEVDAYELQTILNTIFMKEFKFDGFSIDMARSMVAMRDYDYSGKLGFEDYKKLWTDLTVCKRVFRELDSNNDGHFNSYELRNALNSVGYRVSNATFNAIVMRYSDKDGHVKFNDFIAAYVKLKTLFDLFNKKDPSSCGRANFNVEEFTMCTMYC